MKNGMIETKLINFIKEYSDTTAIYWFPLAGLKKEIAVAAYDLDAIYKNDDILSLENVFRICRIRDVNSFQMDQLEYFEQDDIFELLYEKEDGRYNFPWYVETFYFDATEKWMVYVSHEGTISFTGREIVEAAVKSIDHSYRYP